MTLATKEREYCHSKHLIDLRENLVMYTLLGWWTLNKNTF